MRQQHSKHHGRDREEDDREIHAEDPPLAEPEKAVRETGDGSAVRDRQIDAAKRQQGAERDDHRMDPERNDHGAVERTDQGAGRSRSQRRQRHRHADLDHQLCDQDLAERKHRRHRKVDPSQDDDERHSSAMIPSKIMFIASTRRFASVMTFPKTECVNATISTVTTMRPIY